MSNTMAEAFCEEHLITWTEHGEDFTDWRDGDTFTGSQRMLETGAISLFHPLDYDRLLIVTVFPDRSWIVQQEPPGGAPPMVGTREDERRILDLIHILDFIHRTLEAVLVYGDGSKVSDTTFGPNCSKRMSKRPRLEPSLSSASNMLFHLPRRAY